MAVNLLEKKQDDHPSVHSTSSKIAIIGAGISGIAAAKQLSAHNPVVFEATDSIGGVWKHCSYCSTRLQTPRRDYEFSDFPWPPISHHHQENNFPSNTEILDYLQSYASHFDILKFVRFNSKVVELRYWQNETTSTLDHQLIATTANGVYSGTLLAGGNPVWELAVETTHSDNVKVEWHRFEFVVICIGKYGDIPKKLHVFSRNKGPEIFEGKLLHTLDYCKLDREAATRVLENKKVVVVGYKKSAIDLALECAQANQGSEGQPCTMVIRTLHWTVPHYRIWGLHFFLFYSTRSSQFLHERPNQGLLRALLCLLLSPVRLAVSKFIESYLVWKLPLQKYGLKPDHPFEEDYASCQMAILPESFFAEADKGKILFKRATNWCFWKNGVELDEGTRLEADVVVLATGYDGKKKLTSILPQPFRSFLEHPSGLMPLYRGTIHPLIPNIGFVGYVESISNLHSSELSCKWLARLLDDQFKLPSMEKMLEQTSKEIEVMKRATRFYKRHCISTFSINQSDEICEEMGWKSWRKKNWLSEAFSPYSSQDYKEEK